MAKRAWLNKLPPVSKGGGEMIAGGLLLKN